ncbi:MAG: tetratricopeptide repeat protein [Candidatus Peribacteria bacterium]|jgi:tetratricopeptide (TPR) repeat protein|nr:tetratricopeptide repeat protein [Candidatus Peribacteria bacterium]
MRGISYLIKGEEDNDATLLNKAIQDFSKSITLNSGTDPYVSYHWRGRAYELLENYEYAIKDYTKAITLASGRTEKKDSYIGLFSAHL